MPSQGSPGAERGGRAKLGSQLHGASKPAFTTLKPGDTLVRQGQMGSDLYLVLDGVIRVDRDGAQLAEYR